MSDEEKIKLLLEAVQFYANRWTYWEGTNCSFRYVPDEDIELCEPGYEHGGKLARQTLSALGVKVRPRVKSAKS